MLGAAGVKEKRFRVSPSMARSYQMPTERQDATSGWFEARAGGGSGGGHGGGQDEVFSQQALFGTGSERAVSCLAAAMNHRRRVPHFPSPSSERAHPATCRRGRRRSRWRQHPIVPGGPDTQLFILHKCGSRGTVVETKR